MDLKGAEIRNIKNLCSEMGVNGKAKSLYINIPYYQRPYKWGEDNISNLISDYKKNNNNEYFVGATVMVSTPESRHNIIDGQQRLTTMFLFAYLKFLLQRAYVEELIYNKQGMILQGEIQKLTEISNMLFSNSFNLLHLSDDFKEKSMNGEVDDKYYDDFLNDYQNAVYLPEKNLTDESKYRIEYEKKQFELFDKADLALSYSRGTYNDKLKKALSNFIVIVSNSKNPEYLQIESSDDNVYMQYLCALKWEFDCLQSLVDNGINKPLKYVDNLISIIDSILSNIMFCVIITGNKDDAYTLFEVLNDRALEIDDLDLIKNLYYSTYCDKHPVTEDEDCVDKCIECVDDVWVENVFSQSTSIDKAKLISYLAAVFFTADDSIAFNDNEKYRKLLEDKYLSNKKTYSSIDLKNDINIYYLISTLLNTFDYKSRYKYEKSLSAETSNDKTITYKTFHFLNALNQHGVMTALVNVIIKKYISNNMDSDGLIDNSNYISYLNDIIDDKNNYKYKDIHNIAYSLWKTSMLCKDAITPRLEARKIIKNNNYKNLDLKYDIGSSSFKNMLKEFENTLENWTYGNSTQNFKVKVLFINLFEMEKEDNKLKLKALQYTFDTANLDLDHMEANNPNSASLEKYFEPSNQNDRREDYINKLGNFMLLDREDNNNKNNYPLFNAFKFYDNMCSNHWLIDEAKDMMKDDRYSSEILIGKEKYRKPNEEFFRKRKNDLIHYFKSLMTRELDESEVGI